MRIALARVGELLSTVGRQAVPLDGVYGRDWQPVTALAVYWLESFLLALVAVALCSLLKRRTSAAMADAYRSGDYDARRAIEAELEATRKASIDPTTVAHFHLGSLGVFAVFFSMVMFVIIGNHMLEQRFVWSEVREGAVAMLIVVALGFLVDLWRFPSMSVAAIEARVNACLARWGLFWALGFFGTAAMLFTGKATLFVGLFFVLKLTWEVWGTLAGMFGWRSLKDRQASAAAGS